MLQDKPTENTEIPGFLAEFFAQPEKFLQDAKLHSWLDEDPGHQRLFCEYYDIWQGSLKARNTDDYDEHEAWYRLRNSMKIVDLETGRKPHFLIHTPIWKSAIAAAIIAIILILSGLFSYRLYQHVKMPLVYNEYHVPYGSKSAVILPDGSKVWLNAGSRIIYNNRFGIRNRELFLEGEAHFTVAKAKPVFRIKTAGLSVEAVGTIFNLKAYPEENVVETTVEEGIVYIFQDVTGRSSSDKTVLRTNQRATYIHTTGLNGTLLPLNDDPQHDLPVNKTAASDRVIRVNIMENIKPAVYSSWKDERWIIEREELRYLVKKLERRYNVNFSFSDESLKDYVFSGVLKDETLEQVLDYIRHTAPIDFEIQQDQVTLFEVNALKSRI
ncbi:MAG: FecR family protein [Bacteroidales bacterium]|nr:FecR family protein [Bacteroidales bacterium]MBN2761653.1 FecR family protein [Bacteroidales bacterium]